MSHLNTSGQLPESLKEEAEDGKTKLRKWLNMNFRIEMTDGRVLIGVFLCTDRDANVILDNGTEPFVRESDSHLAGFLEFIKHLDGGACSEYLKSNDGETEEPRVLGLVMVPGRHIVSIQIDDMAAQRRNVPIIVNDSMWL